jgi:oligopeptidase A
MTNPLLEDFDLPPFTRIRAEHFEPAVDRVLSDNRAAISRLLGAGGPWTWARLGAPLEALDDRLARIWAPIGHLNNVRNDKAVRTAYGRCLEKITRYETELGQNRELFEAWQALRDSGGYEGLDPARRKAVEDTLRDFRLSGVALEGAARERFREMQERLASLQNRFEENVLDATHAWHHHLTEASQVEGIPEADLARAAGRARDKGLDGWLFSLEFPDYLAVMQQANDRDLRAVMHRAFATRASDTGPHGGQFDNGPVMAEILELRQEEAALLGFDNFAEVSVATKMVDSPEQVLEFLDDLVGGGGGAPPRRRAARGGRGRRGTFGTSAFD